MRDSGQAESIDLSEIVEKRIKDRVKDHRGEKVAKRQLRNSFDLSITIFCN